jgi:hypothetical protein
MFPMDQIPAHSMPPVHRSPYSAVGIILVKQMIFLIIINQPVWVVHPVGFGREMKLGTILLLVISGWAFNPGNFVGFVFAGEGKQREC